MEPDPPQDPLQEPRSHAPESLHAQAAVTTLIQDLPTHLPRWLQPPPPPPPIPPHELKTHSPAPDHCEPEQQDEPESIFYLAYGSNLSAETFRGRRGIEPISQVNVCVPSLKLVFDLPGLPYAEPCFANTERRDPDAEYDIIPSSSPAAQNGPSTSLDEKTHLLSTASSSSSSESHDSSYHKDSWHKPLVGVLYELTPTDFARVIATEGGGSSYKDILVPCYVLPPGSTTVPMHPDTTPIIAHTLFAPTAKQPDDPDVPDNGRSARPDPGYAQPSARYLKLLHDGAIEHSLPHEYQDYLAKIRPYRITTNRQRMGGLIFSAVWMPLVMIVFGIQRLVADDKGRSPKWMQQITGAIFSSVWISYDGLFKKIFGDGERTIGE